MVRAREKRKEERERGGVLRLQPQARLRCRELCSLRTFDKNRSSLNTKCRWTTIRIKVESVLRSISGIAPQTLSYIVACSPIEGRYSSQNTVCSSLGRTTVDQHEGVRCYPPGGSQYILNTQSSSSTGSKKREILSVSQVNYPFVIVIFLFHDNQQSQKPPRTVA